MSLPFEFDFCKPDYTKVWKWRLQTLQVIRDNPGTLDAFKAYYATRPGEFITHWGSTYDPRNADIGLPTVIPFVLFPRQEEWCTWLMAHWRNREPGLSQKSRDMGLSWLAVGSACTLCLFNDGISIGFGSRKEEYVDKVGDPKSIFWKARKFMQLLPRDFTGGFNLKTHSPYMRMLFPDNGSTIVGEAGDGIGRGDRKTIYFVDESAYLERPQLIEESLSQTTNCRIDISSAHGMGNPFAQKVHSGRFDVFTFHWRQDPRKAEHIKFMYKGMLVNWYQKQEMDLDPVTLAQEVDINYSASVEGIVLPFEWVNAAVDACKTLGIEPTGARTAALDIADSGKDLNAFVVKYGPEIVFAKDWSGKAPVDTLITMERAHAYADDMDVEAFQYDSDGLGAATRSDIRTIATRRAEQKRRAVRVIPFRGSGEVVNPEKPFIEGLKEANPRLNKDMYKNRKSQGWWSLRLLFQYTYRAVQAKKNGEPFELDTSKMISISSKVEQLQKLLMELTQVTYTWDVQGKLLIDKSPDNTPSPNLADGVMILYAPMKKHNSLFS